MKILIIKRGATGDVVRTTTLLNVIKGEIHWLTDDNNLVMIDGISKIEKCISWSNARLITNAKYDLVINLEDCIETANLLNKIEYTELFGAYLDNSDSISYTESSKEWFDLSIISNHGKKKADELKLNNRKTYQEMIFEGLGFPFKGERYILPDTESSELKADIAIAPKSGSVWPMKNWAFYDDLAAELRKKGFSLNFLPTRDTLAEHLADIKNHCYLISGDSLPMHIALGCGIKCLTIFICTSPWEIYDYGLQKKIVSPKLSDYFYKRHFDKNAVASIPLNSVLDETLKHFGSPNLNSER